MKEIYQFPMRFTDNLLPRNLELQFLFRSISLILHIKINSVRAEKKIILTNCRVPDFVSKKKKYS